MEQKWHIRTRILITLLGMTFALLLDICLHVARHSDAVHAGKWTACPDFCFWEKPLIELSGKTMGVVGFGRIGRAVARVAVAMGMKVLGYDPAITIERAWQLSPSVEQVTSVEEAISSAYSACQFI